MDFPLRCHRAATSASLVPHDEGVAATLVILLHRLDARRRLSGIEASPLCES